jgi:hypothetical protein
MAPKKNRKQAQETMLEEPIEEQVVPSESIGEEEPRVPEDQDEPESEKEQWSSVLFTSEQLEVLLKMNRPDFSELVAAFKGGASKDARFQPAKPGNFDGARDRKVVDAWLAKMEDYLHVAKVGQHLTMELAQSYLKGYAATWWRMVRQEEGKKHGYCNPSFGLATKAKGLQGCGPRGRKPGSQCKGIARVRTKRKPRNHITYSRECKKV